MAVRLLSGLLEEIKTVVFKNTAKFNYSITVEQFLLKYVVVRITIHQLTLTNYMRH